MTEKEIEEGIFKYENDTQKLKEHTIVFIRNFKEPSFNEITSKDKILAAKRYFELKESKETEKLEINKELDSQVKEIRKKLKKIYSKNGLKSTNLFEYNVRMTFS